MANQGKASPSAARTLSSSEIADLAATALALPSGWLVTLEPPHGQLAIGPAVGAPKYFRCWVADGATRRVFRRKM